MAYIKPKPILRNEYDVNLRATITNFVQKQLCYQSGHPYKNCLNCTHWNFGEDLCGKFKAKPPTDIIVYSCPEHEDNDDIPF